MFRLFHIVPNFRGKFRLAHFFFGSRLAREGPLEILGKHAIRYNLPNTMDNIGREIFVNGVYEKRTVDLITDLLKGGGVFFDIGANIGAISLPVAKLTNAELHVFEPARRTFQFLKKNKQVNHVENMILNNTAVHSVDGEEVIFFDVPENYGGSSLMQTYADQPRYHVNTISVDEYCKRENIQSVQVIKIDVQGFEVEVLRGCHKMLAQKSIANIIFEFEGWAETNAHFDAGSAQQYLVDMGYELFTLQNQRLASIVTTGSEMIWAKSGN